LVERLLSLRHRVDAVLNISEVLLGRIQLGSGGGDIGRRRRALLGGIQLGLGGGNVVRIRTTLREGEPGLGGLELGLGLLHLQGQVARVQLDQHLARLDVVAGADIDFGQPSGDAQTEHLFAHSDQLAGCGHALHHIAAVN
jgi:hypothetical protein